jgi:hypothetical protein
LASFVAASVCDSLKKPPWMMSFGCKIELIKVQI